MPPHIGRNREQSGHFKRMTQQHTVRLADYAASLRYEDIPGDVIEIAKNTIGDGLGACVFGYRFPWSQAIVRYAAAGGGAGGRSAVLGLGAPPLHAPFAALVNGALAHSFELDAGTRRGVGAHPFGTVFTAALPVAQAKGRSGKDLLTAFVAGSEALLRIGRATGRSNEHRGFHAPGTTGPFGAAIACALLLGLDRECLLNAVGIAGSLASGLRQFSVSRTGAMVKRLHFGRAAEGGVMAASLAAEGFDGPHDILEGTAGFLHVFCDHHDADELTLGLDGSTFHMRQIHMKRFGTHGSCQLPLQALLAIRASSPFEAGEIESIELTAAREALDNHDNSAPADLMQAQYSVPFCLALACVRDARDPRSIDESALTDPDIRALIPRIRLERSDTADKRSCDLTVRLKRGVEHHCALPAPGSTWKPATREETYAKYTVLMRDCPRSKADELFERIHALETERDLDWFRL
jgi:2-methylcitrate dehydratase PrpD